jgi:predicted esterase YcpF (UPF0227 family)
VAAITQPLRHYAVIAKGDEVPDCRDTTAPHPGAHIHLLEGGDHAWSDFDAHLPDLLRFLKLLP